MTADGERIRIRHSADGGVTWRETWAHVRSVIAKELADHERFIDGMGNVYERAET